MFYSRRSVLKVSVGDWRLALNPRLRSSSSVSIINRRGTSRTPSRSSPRACQSPAGPACSFCTAPSTQPRTGRRQRSRGAKRWPAGAQPSPGKVIGTIKRWIPDKRFGFIGPASGEPDIFVHISNIARESPDSEPIDDLRRWDVEYQAAKDSKDRVKAVKVSGPNGRALPV